MVLRWLNIISYIFQMFACVGGARDWLDQTHFMLQLWVPKDCA